ncbi:MAG: DUF5615 family PIN-like protein [Nitrospira sp.]|nr:DUF5615 family PIN-like protein [Nitrospira sp.]
MLDENLSEFLLVTRDEDFLRMSLLRGAPPKVIWITLGNCSNGGSCPPPSRSSYRHLAVCRTRRSNISSTWILASPGTRLLLCRQRSFHLDC